MPNSAVADVVADVQQTPIFVVAAVADINLRRTSQFNAAAATMKMGVCYTSATTSATAAADGVADV